MRERRAGFLWGVVAAGLAAGLLDGLPFAALDRVVTLPGGGLGDAAALVIVAGWGGLAILAARRGWTGGAPPVGNGPRTARFTRARPRPRRRT